MRRLTIIIFFLCASAPFSFPAEDPDTGWAANQVSLALNQRRPIPWDKDALVVSKAEVAIAIHQAVTGAIYGEATINKEKPFHAVRSGGFWVVIGSLPKGFLGGTAITVIRASNGEVLRVIHEQ